MFGRKKDEAAAEDAAVDNPYESTEAPPEGKKGPTPKRSEQEALNKRPLVSSDKKARKEAERKRRIESQERLRLANETGDERYMMPRDQGPQKRFARDFVDSRWMIGEFLMIIIFAFLIVSFTMANNLVVQANITIALWAILLITIIDAFIMTRMLKKRLVARFGESERGVLWYASMRGLQFRKMRLPKPQVKRGEGPRD
ncbi:DUF3043 domain-containing protein [Zhihengliuella salsuginis]|uniref:DUF3043 domain-containing protein n=1 Tax=Zhihengliuella salsuginis TaxID=578222 RepID=A0ABQ3GM71_9MICC|nr:DUF3043 domain-containing protein [Zhihengliuella salsuginis]GHD12585.1 hypothetical protein GCM10008096_28080 [Zhihengliuella salsuginis]